MFITKKQFEQFTERVCDETDVLADIYCSAACDVVSDYLGYNPELSERTIIVKGNGENKISLGVKPIRQIKRVMIGATNFDAETYASSDHYLIDVDGGIFCKDSEIVCTVDAGWDSDEMPGIIKMTALRIAGMLANEGGGNVGIQSKSFSETGSRVFMNTKFDKYLEAIDAYRLYKIGV